MYDTMNNQAARIGDTIAAIDLGSNSFHLAIARVLENRVQILHRVKQRVQLAEGMDDEGNLAEAAIARGLACLTQFAQHLQTSQISQIRVVATYALRRAPNRNRFVKPARKILNSRIDVIPGTEEARLIYRGVAQARQLENHNLVIDIGGGSTELVLGQGPTPILLESLDMGCVSYQDRFFADGKLSAKRFDKASLAAQQQLELLQERYTQLGWQHAIGCSGTIKAIAQLCGEPPLPGLITQDALESLCQRLSEHGLSDPRFAHLSDSRLRVLPAGLAVLLGCFRALGIDNMQFCDAALREGVIVEMSGEQPHDSVCATTVAAMERLHHIDTTHASQVAQTAVSLYQQSSQPNDELSALLGWAGRLHEVGLSLNFKGMHRHTGYILAHSNLPGFTIEQQQLLALLGRFQRKRLDDFAPLELELASAQQQQQLLMALRLAVLWHLGRRHTLPPPRVTWHSDGLTLELNPSVQTEPLLLADLQQEQQLLAARSWQVKIVAST
ncbi:Ppx/GppA phosphatase family protein [Ferrimonas pelagia]|uniref:Exopolyphosphatase n=1 Tax=Ferrimonas pelagia TaxID=1177826 RepID=A0ABP9FM13_9GAMM